MSLLATNILDTLTRDFIGSRQLLDQLNVFYDKTPQQSFPPYNIVETDTGYEIQLAIAGYDKSEIVIENEDNNLVIRGTKPDKQENFIYRGIASRAFERKFLLKDNIIVNGAEYNNGILKIAMKKIEPERLQRKLIAIT